MRHQGRGHLSSHRHGRRQLHGDHQPARGWHGDGHGAAAVQQRRHPTGRERQLQRGLYSRLDYTFAAAGTYYLGVSGARNTNYNPNTGGSGAVGSTGDYRLDVSLDIGDTLGAAVPTGLVLGGSFAQPNTPLGDGAFGSSDVDFYQFVAPAGSN